MKGLSIRNVFANYFSFPNVARVPVACISRVNYLLEEAPFYEGQKITKSKCIKDILKPRACAIYHLGTQSSGVLTRPKQLSVAAGDC